MTLAPADLLTLLAQRAPELRAAGIHMLKFGNVEVRMTLHEPAPPPAGEQRQGDEDHSDPLNDPSTYGRAGSVPGFHRPERDDEENPR